MRAATAAAEFVGINLGASQDVAEILRLLRDLVAVLTVEERLGGSAFVSNHAVLVNPVGTLVEENRTSEGVFGIAMLVCGIIVQFVRGMLNSTAPPALVTTVDPAEISRRRSARTVVYPARATSSARRDAA